MIQELKLRDKVRIVNSKNDKQKELNLYAVTDGKVTTVEKVDDPVFAEKFIGDGYALLPSTNEIKAPAAGKIISIAEMKHAYYIEVLPGVRILIHVGKDTLMLGGEGFNSFVKQGDVVSKGDVLGDVDLQLLQDKGYSSVINVVVLYDEAYSFEIEGLLERRVVGGEDKCCSILFS